MRIGEKSSSSENHYNNSGLFADLSNTTEEISDSDSDVDSVSSFSSAKEEEISDFADTQENVDPGKIAAKTFADQRVISRSHERFSFENVNAKQQRIPDRKAHLRFKIPSGQPYPIPNERPKKTSPTSISQFRI